MAYIVMARSRPTPCVAIDLPGPYSTATFTARPYSLTARLFPLCGRLIVQLRAVFSFVLFYFLFHFKLRAVPFSASCCSIFRFGAVLPSTAKFAAAAELRAAPNIEVRTYACVRACVRACVHVCARVCVGVLVHACVDACLCWRVRAAVDFSYIVMAYIVMAYIVMVYIVMAPICLRSRTSRRATRAKEDALRTTGNIVVKNVFFQNRCSNRRPTCRRCCVVRGYTHRHAHGRACVCADTNLHACTHTHVNA